MYRGEVADGCITIKRIGKGRYLYFQRCKWIPAEKKGKGKLIYETIYCGRADNSSAYKKAYEMLLQHLNEQIQVLTVIYNQRRREYEEMLKIS